jgi:hypothetical protein
MVKTIIDWPGDQNSLACLLKISSLKFKFGLDVLYLILCMSAIVYNGWVRKSKNILNRILCPY